MKNVKLKLGACLILLAMLFTVAVRTVDVSAVGPEGTAVGFAHLNQAVADAVGVHLMWYAATGVLGAQALFLAAVFALCGLYQLIRRRSLWKVDPELLALAGLYAVTLGVYIFFEVCIINYRPLIMPGELAPEASFPSSHTMLACVILGSAMLLAGRYIVNPRLRRAARIICGIMCAAVILGRLYSGVHWFTDICGGILYGAALLCLFAGTLDCIPSPAERGQLPPNGKPGDAGRPGNRKPDKAGNRNGRNAGNAGNPGNSNAGSRNAGNRKPGSRNAGNRKPGNRKKKKKR